MDYEKMYNEALKRAKAAIDIAADKDLVGGVVRTIFPQLRENEDEMIRKELKEAFEAYDIESKWNGIPIRSIFAWLEKQKEQKPKNILTDDDSLQTAYLKGQTDVLEDPEAYGLQKEKKPVEWSEEDEKMLDAMIDMVSNSLYEPLCPREGMLAWLESLRPQYHGDVTMTEAYKMGLEAGKASSWKPSEEQMEALHTAMYLEEMQFYGGLKDKLRDLYEQLKKL